MATRFGGARPSRVSNLQMRWLVGFCFSIIFVLILTIVLLLQQQPSQTAPVVPDASLQLASPEPSGMVPILVALQRIESGTPLNFSMFREELTAVEAVPPDAVRASEKPSLIGTYANQLILPNLPLRREDVTDKPPLGITEKIPPGYRAVTIEVTQVSSVEGFTRPDTRVDVLWTFTDRDGQKKVVTIVRFAKILSFGGITGNATQQNAAAANANNQGRNTVTILVTQRESQMIELARNTGSLGMVLVGDGENPTLDEPASVIRLTDLVQDAPAQVEGEDPVDGRMIVKDERTGQHVAYCLRGKRWEKCE